MEKNLWSCYEPAQLQELEHISGSYLEFLSEGKTERECVRQAVRLARQAGYRPLDGRAAPGDRVYLTAMDKTAVFFQLGSVPPQEGLNILGAHIDSPRLDVKQRPLYQENGLAYFDLHYYGGIKKYQWVALPLAIHGVVVRRDGTVCPVCIGEEAGEPVLCVTDLLPHLAGEQMDKKADKVIEGAARPSPTGRRTPSAPMCSSCSGSGTRLRRRTCCPPNWRLFRRDSPGRPAWTGVCCWPTAMTTGSVPTPPSAPC